MSEMLKFNMSNPPLTDICWVTIGHPKFIVKNQLVVRSAATLHPIPTLTDHYDKVINKGILSNCHKCNSPVLLSPLLQFKIGFEKLQGASKRWNQSEITRSLQPRTAH